MTLPDFPFRRGTWIRILLESGEDVTGIFQGCHKSFLILNVKGTVYNDRNTTYILYSNIQAITILGKHARKKFRMDLGLGLRQTLMEH